MTPKEDRIVVKDTHEGIVSEEVWTQVQNMLDKRKNTNKSGITYDNIFKGLVKCPYCNYALTPKTEYHRQMALSSRENFVMKIAEKIDKDKTKQKS